MNVLLLTSWYPDKQRPNSGIFIQTQAEALTTGHTVTVISARVDYERFAFMGWESESITRNGINEHRLTIKRSLPVYNQLNSLFVMLLYSWRMARRCKPDVIHASVGYPGAFWGWMLSVILRKPFVFTEHTRHTNNFRSFFHKRLTMVGVKRADAIIAVSTALGREIANLYKRRVTVIPNTIETSRFHISTKQPGGNIDIGFMGGLNTDVKGLDVLLNALQGLDDKRFHLHIAGAGALQQVYEQQAHHLEVYQQCTFYGFVPYDQVPSFMSQLDFFVCSSRYETFCVALIEAMASGRPVVSTRCGGPEDFVTKENGILVENGNVRALREGISAMSRNYIHYNKEVIREFVIMNFSKNSFLERINAVYAKVSKMNSV